ncbi:SurA N-terminal domain-containing protein [Lysobacter sp. A6]|uniref:Periplasmic chaperone PpiD n=1 Tax=Noviluteimonas lactosilytica TaxID=2888523 RepID=A0ABS8JEP6_9GAMM|nr:SurA N-terminal domain-containing protein [Lysobacter lactosilyticus]MCC8362076.1 SurA N-terminal domain-containing protein [Lysobacter lactosilyticus]
MLQKLREKTSGWIASVILGLLTIPFAFFGVESYMQQSSENWVAKIEAPPTWWAGAPSFWPVSTMWQREEITPNEFRQAFENARQAQRQQLGENYDPRAFETPENKRAILEQLIDQRVLKMAASRAGVTVSDAEVKRTILEFPAFQVDGKFNADRYQLALSSQQLTPRGFENEIRESLQVELLPRGLNDSAFVTKAEMDRLLKLLAEERSVSFVVLPPQAADTGPVTGKEIDAYWKAHRNEFRAPEQVTIEYVEVNAATLAVPAADEATLRQRFEKEKGTLGGSGERLVSHILVAVPKDADAAAQKAAEAKANKLATEAKAAGADFAALAAANSDDAVSKANGGDLGWVGKGVMEKPFEDAVFAMKAGDISGPVRTDFGWHVLQVREVKGATQQTFEEAHAQLAQEQAEADRERAFNDLTSKLVDLVNKNPTALAPAAGEAKLAVNTLGPFGRDGAAGIAANKAVQRAAFSDSAIQDGLVSDLVELAPDHVVMLRVTNHVPARELTPAQVRDRIVASIRAERTRKAGEAAAEAMLAKLKAGTPLAAAAAEKGLVPVDMPNASRGAPLPDRKATQAYFGVPAPAAGKVSPGFVALDDGSHVVFAVSKVVEGDPSKATADERMVLQRQLAQSGGADDAKAFIATMRKSMDVKVAEERL